VIAVLVTYRRLLARAKAKLTSRWAKGQSHFAHRGPGDIGRISIGSMSMMSRSGATERCVSSRFCGRHAFSLWPLPLKPTPTGPSPLVCIHSGATEVCVVRRAQVDAPSLEPRRSQRDAIKRSPHRSFARRRTHSWLPLSDSHCAMASVTLVSEQRGHACTNARLPGAMMSNVGAQVRKWAR
jgi:hypothetical protein